MDSILVKGGRRLSGEVAVSGSKNSALPILFATLLAEGEHTINNVPQLADIDSTAVLLEQLGAEVRRSHNELKVKISKIKDPKAHYDVVRKMRASILCLGPLLARCGKAVVSLPGGCAIGTRPIDQHIEAFKVLGARIETEGGYVTAEADKLIGGNVVFDGVTVGGTENLLMAAVLADGRTTIENAAKEPEIGDLAKMLNKMGAKISGAGTSTIIIDGVKNLTPTQHTVIPDRIEAGTLLIAGAITGGEVTLKNCVPQHLESLIYKLREAGLEIDIEADSITIHPSSRIKAVDVTTAAYPGFATDLQAQFTALMTQAEGTSVITEMIFENRFMHIQELNRLNADITPKTKVAIIRGQRGGLVGAPVMATDLRASASLVLAGLAADGVTEINRVYHLDRGYEKLEQKLAHLGADVKRVKS
jgi:UDP-N-acetylglucosamine 1-carboxyvinyltransferase